MELTLEESLAAHRNQAQHYFLKYTLISVCIVIVLAAINFLVFKYYLKRPWQKLTLTLAAINLFILVFSSYLASENYYQGLVHEILWQFP